MRTARVLICALAIWLPTHGALAQTLVNTISAWNGFQSVGTFGYPNTATYGQVITVPATDTLLADFTLFVSLPPTSIFRAAVYAWDGVNIRATGPSLFESAPRSAAAPGIHAEKFAPPAPIELLANRQYILLISVSKDAGSGVGSIGYTGSDSYGGGAFYSLNNGADATQWTSIPWSPYDFPVRGDLAFIASFEPALAPPPIPVGAPPASLPIPGLGHGALILLALSAAAAGALSLRRPRH